MDLVALPANFPGIGGGFRPGAWPTGCTASSPTRMSGRSSSTSPAGPAQSKKKALETVGAPAGNTPTGTARSALAPPAADGDTTHG
ncbi:hypothetical protein [Streptomyces sp. NBC_01451]|uniref:hypothetical protein n=1 Tax=Streptomyces sp. NBC_01451 TaxID=2903872 RepID=UPI002E354D12|nr:hypothetical protein [Streptomyces sp. NBC_01451]